MISLPAELDRTLGTRWPDYLDIEGLKHSDESWSLVLLDSDYRYYTFRAVLSSDGRWSIIPISGFDEGRTGWLLEGEL